MKTVGALLSSLLLSAMATQAHSDQLATVKERGTLICGALAGAPPISYQDQETRQVVGYDIDLCKEIAAGLGVKHEIKVVGVAGRVPELEQRRVDVLTAIFTYTPERAKAVDFSNTYLSIPERIAVMADSGITTLAGLDGKRIAGTEGSTSSQFARAAVPGATVVDFKETANAFQAFRQGKTDAIGTNSLILRQYQMALEEEGIKMHIIEEPTYEAPTAVGIAKGETALKDAVNEVLVNLDKSGKIDELWDKWLGMNSIYKMPRSFKVIPPEEALKQQQ